MIASIISWVLAVTQGLGYIGIAILMAVESSFLPLPPEIVIPPAAYLASQGRMNIFLIVLCGVFGSVLGATINYWLSAWLGRKVVYRLAASRYAKFFLINPDKVRKAEKYFLSNANSATFYGRLVPVIRHLISIPAGFSRMPLSKFLAFTALGSLVWVSVLCFLGYFIGENQALISLYAKEISIGLLFLATALFIFHAYRTRRNKKRIEKKAAGK